MFAHTRRRRPRIPWRSPAPAGRARPLQPPRLASVRCGTRVLPRAAAARSSLRGRRFLASARPMARPVSQLSALPRHACSHNRPPRSRCGGERTVRARLSRGAVRLRHPLAMTACPGVARPVPQQPSLPALLGIRLLPPTESCAQWQLHAPWASCFSAAARTPLVGSGFPRRSAQKSDQLNAGRFGSLSLWQFANYAQIIQRVPSGDDQARRPADGA